MSHFWVFQLSIDYSYTDLSKWRILYLIISSDTFSVIEFCILYFTQVVIVYTNQLIDL